jgi:hypothetical protein
LLPFSSDNASHDRQGANISNRTETSTIHVCQTVNPEIVQDIELYPCVKKVST